MVFLHGICSFSNHEPETFPFPFSEGSPEYENLRKNLCAAIVEAYDRGYEMFITGMTRGFGILAGEAVCEVREKSGLPIFLCAAIPYKKQPDKWNSAWKMRYHRLLMNCEGQKNVFGFQTYARGLERFLDQYLIDHTTLLICYYDGRQGDAQEAYFYAKEKERSILNLAVQDYTKSKQIPGSIAQ